MVGKHTGEHCAEQETLDTELCRCPPGPLLEGEDSVGCAQVSGRVSDAAQQQADRGMGRSQVGAHLQWVITASQRGQASGDSPAGGPVGVSRGKGEDSEPRFAHTKVGGLGWGASTARRRRLDRSQKFREEQSHVIC